MANAAREAADHHEDERPASHCMSCGFRRSGRSTATATPVWAGILPADEASTDRPQAIDEEARQDAGGEAERGQHDHRGQRESVRLLCALAAAGVRGRPRNVTPKALTKHAAASAADEGEQRADCGHQEFQPPRGKLRAEQDRLERQPLGDEAVERRQGGDRCAADQEHESGLTACGGSGRRDDSMSRSPVASSTAPAPKKSRLLNMRVVEDVEAARLSEPTPRRRASALALKGERQAEADEDDADILDRAVGEQPLEVVLHQRMEHAHDGGAAAESPARPCSTTNQVVPTRSKTMRMKP